MGIIDDAAAELGVTPIARPSLPAPVDHLNAAASNLEPDARLRLLRKHLNGTLIFTTSFGLEDQVLTDFIHAARIEARFVTLDTGRLFPETYRVGRRPSNAMVSGSEPIIRRQTTWSAW